MKTLIAREQRLPLAMFALLGAMVLIVPFPGSLSVVWTRFLSSSSNIPGVELLSEGLLLLLAAATVTAMAFTCRPYPDRRLAMAPERSVWP